MARGRGRWDVGLIGAIGLISSTIVCARALYPPPWWLSGWLGVRVGVQRRVCRRVGWRVGVHCTVCRRVGVWVDIHRRVCRRGFSEGSTEVLDLLHLLPALS